MMKAIIILLSISLLISQYHGLDPIFDKNNDVPSETVCDDILPNAWVPTGYCASIWTSGLSRPRGIVTAENGDILVVEAGASYISVLWDDEGTIQKAVLASASGLNHAIAIQGPYLYASSATTVFRWMYTAGDRSNLGSPQTVINSVACCGHTTRTIAFDQAGLLYLSVGSQSNVDPDSSHANIRRFVVTNVPPGGINWSTGFLFADGLRNEVGIAVDSMGRIWGVENGVDNLNRADLGGDIHQNNPSEEVNLFAEPGKFYGYPYCWSEDILPIHGKGKGTQWVQPQFMNDGVHSDEWCEDTSNVVLPLYNLGAHQAPMDIKFYDGDSFPSFPAGGAFVSLHGSWNRQPSAGYSLLYLNFENGLPVSDSVVLRHDGSSANWPNNVRPVGITFKKCGTQDCIYLSSDASGQIIEISYTGTK